MSEAIEARQPTPTALRAANISAKAALVLLLVLAMLYPEASNLREKGAEVRAVGYPLVSFIVPMLWWAFWKDRATYPWLADFLITLTCFTDVLGNRMDFYDSIEWFDDWMHLMNNALLVSAVLLLTLPRSASLGRTLERALAFGATAAIAWEVAEYYSFISRSTERRFAYADTLSDLSLGTLGSVAAALVVHRLWQQRRLAAVEPMPPFAASAEISARQPL